jgi:hypothetical protein
MKIKHIVSLFISLAFLIPIFSCSGGGGGASSPPPPTTGSVTGALSVSNLVLPASASVTSASNSKQADIVRLKSLCILKAGLMKLRFYPRL